MPVIRRVGAARVSLSAGLPLLPMAGYAVQSPRAAGRPAAGSPGELWARALVVERDDGRRYAFLFADLWGPSAGLLAHVGAVTQGLGLPHFRILLATTHTHTGPARYFNNGLWNQAPTTGVHNQATPAVVRALRDACVGALRAAVDDLQTGTLTLAEDTVWGVGANRSRAPFDAAGSLAGWHTFLGVTPPAGLDPLHARVDPRLRVLLAHQTVGGATHLRAAFGVFACHATALGQAAAAYHADWPGLACHAVERVLGAAHPRGVVAALAQGAAGDVTPLAPTGGQLPAAPAAGQGVARAHAVAERVANGVLGLAGTAPAPDQGFTWEATLWDPEATLPGPTAGAPALGGAEDFRSCVYPGSGTREGVPGPAIPGLPAPQRPKWGSALPHVAIALGFLNGQRGPRAVPLRRIRLGGDTIFTCPGEPTGRTLQALAGVFAADGGRTVGIGYSGEYIGYLTTPAEYALQHYEGALSVYGAGAVPALAAALRRSTPWPLVGAPGQAAPVLDHAGASALPADAPTQAAARAALQAAFPGIEREG